MPCFKPTTNPQLDAERTALGKISPQVDAEKVLNASPFTPQSTCTAATHDRDSSKDNRDMNEEMCTSHTPDDKITQLPFSKLSRFRTLRLERELRQSSFIRPGLRVEAFSFLGLPETAALRYKPKTTRTLLAQLLNQANPEAQPLAHCTVGIDGRCFGITPGAN